MEPKDTIGLWNQKILLGYGTKIYYWVMEPKDTIGLWNQKILLGYGTKRYYWVIEPKYTIGLYTRLWNQNILLGYGTKRHVCTEQSLAMSIASVMSLYIRTEEKKGHTKNQHEDEEELKTGGLTWGTATRRAQDRRNLRLLD